MRRYNPAGIAAPASNYSHGVSVPAESRRVVVSGQIGLKPDGTVEQPGADQIRRCWSNLFTVLAEESLGKEHLVKVTVFLTRPQDIPLYREIRDAVLDGHAPASTLLIVAGLAMPELTVEIEGEAIG